MIYIPIQLQLKWIREDLEQIKSHICNHYPRMSWPCCPDCGDESCIKFSKCGNAHREYMMRINIPME